MNRGCHAGCPPPPGRAQAFAPAVNGGMFPRRTSATRNFLKINGLICVCLEFRTLGSPSAIRVSYHRSSAFLQQIRNQSHARFRAPARRRDRRRARDPRLLRVGNRGRPGCGRPPAAISWKPCSAIFPADGTSMLPSRSSRRASRSSPALSRGRLCSAICGT